MRVLVTGATGYLGSHLIPALLKQKFSVVALVRNPKEVQSLSSQSCTLVKGDVVDQASMAAAFAERVDIVFHLAALVGVRHSDREALEQVNVEGTRNVVALCKRHKVSRLIHTSSVVAVGASASPDIILNEESVNPLASRGFANVDTKSRGEAIVLEAARSNELNAIVLNLSMVFGAGDARKVIRKGNVMAARGRAPLYPGGGISVVAVEDAVAAMITATEKGQSGERYIISGENLTLKEVMSMYAEQCGARPPRHKIPSWLLRGLARFVEAAHLDIPLTLEGAVTATSYSWFDHSKATREFGFHPRPAREAIKNSVEWMRGNGYLESSKSAPFKP